VTAAPTVNAASQTTGTPHFIGQKGSNGVIRQVPGNCGPEAHTENHAKYGLSCIQNKSKMAEVNLINSAQCYGGKVSGHLSRCQQMNLVTPPPCVDSKGSNKRPDGRFYSCRYINGVMYIE
jgi:hypothetical protein